MASRLHYALPFARQLVTSSARQLQGRRPVDVQTKGRPFIIVTGLGRSGTSAVARVLHESGLSMGDHFRDPTIENETGFYEELPVCDLNDEIMAECGIAGLRRYPMRTTVLAVARQYRDQMRALVVVVCPTMGPWVSAATGGHCDSLVTTKRSMTVSGSRNQTLKV